MNIEKPCPYPFASFSGQGNDPLARACLAVTQNHEGDTIAIVCDGEGEDGEHASSTALAGLARSSEKLASLETPDLIRMWMYGGLTMSCPAPTLDRITVPSTFVYLAKGTLHVAQAGDAGLIVFSPEIFSEEKQSRRRLRYRPEPPDLGFTNLPGTPVLDRDIIVIGTRSVWEAVSIYDDLNVPGSGLDVPASDLHICKLKTPALVGAFLEGLCVKYAGPSFAGVVICPV